MIFPSRSQLASKQIRRTGRAEAVTTIEDVLAVENDVVPFDRADVLGAGLRPVPGSAKERVLMLYFNTNVGATLKIISDGLRTNLVGTLTQAALAAIRPW